MTENPHLSPMELEITINKKFKDKIHIIPSKQKIKNLVYNYQNKLEISKNEFELLKNLKNFKNLDYFQKLVIDKNNNMVCILSTQFMMLRATDPSNVQFFGDGYFNVPKSFYQIYAIHTFDSLTNMYIPCVYFLLSNKSYECYKLGFFNWKCLLEEEFQNRRKFSPQSLMMDFEFSARKACFDILPVPFASMLDSQSI